MADTKKLLVQVPSGSSLLGVDSGAIKRFPITALAKSEAITGRLIQQIQARFDISDRRHYGYCK